MIGAEKVCHHASRSRGYGIGTNGESFGVDGQRIARTEFAQVNAVPARRYRVLNGRVEIVRGELPVEIGSIACRPLPINALNDTAT